MNEWIKHEPGECPVDLDAVVDIRLRRDTIDTSIAGNYAWGECGEYTIAEYRVVAEAVPSESEDVTVITRRDQFAMAALQGMLAAFDVMDKAAFLRDAQLSEWYSRAAYGFANAMESARKGGA